MPVALRCPCGNLSFSLAAAPQPVPTPPGFPTAIKRFGRAELTVAGANWVWEVLIETKSATPEWRVTRCLNCSTDCYAQRAGTQELLVNAELRPRDETPGADGGLHWSAALGVAVEANPDVSNSLLEAPEVMDDRAVELFQALQRTVESHVGAHTAAVHERIRAFEEEQREALSAYTINAYRDRKVLWHNICRALARRHALPASPSPPQPAAPAAVSAAAAAISTSAPTAPATPAPAPAPAAPSLAVLTDRSSPGPASAAVAEWLRASSSAAPLVALVHDADSPRIVRAPTASAAAPAPAAPSPSLPSVAPASSAIAPVPAPAPAPTPVAAPTPTAAAALSDASASQPLRLPSPRPRGGYGGQAQLSRPMQVAASAPVRSALSEEGDVFRLEEDEAAPAEPLAPAPDDDEERTELPPLRSRAAYREPPPALGGAEALFGTSVPISIPPPRAPPSATPATAAPAGAAGDAADMSLDVPLSSTRRMKGYL